MQTLTKQTILVTGASGFIGKVVVAALLTQGYPVVAMVRPRSIVSLPIDDNLTLLRADITEYDSYASSVGPCTAIVHLAANKYDPKLAPQVNLQGALNLVRLIKEKRINGKRIINVSTQSTKIKHKGVYGKTKDASDRIIEQNFVRWTTIKPSLVYGDEVGSLFTAIANYTRLLPAVPVIGNGKWELYPIDVADVATAIVGALENDQAIQKTYDLGCKEKITFDQLIGVIQQTIGVKKPIVHIPMWAGFSITWLASKVIANLPITTDNILGSNQNTDCDPLPAIRDFHYQPITIGQGVKKYLGQNGGGKMRIALVGLGKMGTLHATVLATIENAVIVALIDKDRALTVTAQSMGIQAPAFTSLADAFAATKIDAVYICTPNFTHAKLMEECVAHRLPFFIEKPVVTDIDDFTAIMKNGNKAILNRSAAGYFWVYRREIQYTKNLLDQHTIGDIVNYHVTLKHSEVFGPKKGWLFVKKLSGGGVLINPGPHALSIIHYFFGAPAVESSSIKNLYGNEVDDEAKVQFRHPKGPNGRFDASWSVKGYPVLTIEYEIIGTTGSIRFQNNQLTVERKDKPKQILDYTQIPQQNEIFDLNPKAGGEGYYQEDKLFIGGLISPEPIINSLPFAHAIEQTIATIYEKSK